jgi:hypothetical protein
MNKRPKSREETPKEGSGSVIHSAAAYPMDEKQKPRIERGLL